MKLSTKGRYGLRAIIDLAIHESDSFVSLSSIALRQKISLNYLEQCFSVLKKAGIVTGMSGSSGGYKLAKNPKEITVAMVLEALEGELSIVEKSINVPTDYESFVREKIWNKIDNNIKDVIENITLNEYF